MELRIECLEGSSVPIGCYVGVRVGDILKQGRYEPQRCYNFPAIERRRNAKIDVYRHIGTCVVGVDPEAKSFHEVNVQSTDGSSLGMKLKVNVSSTCDLGAGKQHEARMKAVKDQAKDYLSKHRIEEKLSGAVKDMLRERPADPTDFICRHLRGEESPVPTAAEKLPSVMLGPSLTRSRASPAGPLPPGTTSKAMASPKPIVLAPSLKPAQMLPFKEYYKTHMVQVRSKVFFDKLYNGFPTRATSEPVSQAPVVADVSQVCDQAQDVLLQAHVSPRPLVAAKAKLKVKIVGATGLRDADWAGTSDPYCVCRLPRKPDFNFQTKVACGNLDPEWNEEFVEDFVSGDTLEFSILDSDAGKADNLLGRVTLKSEVFLQSGFQGALPLSDARCKGAVNVMIEVMSELTQEAPVVKQLSQLRHQTRDALIHKCHDGSLYQALKSYREATDTRLGPSTNKGQVDDFALMPSVGTWLARRQGSSK